MSQAMLGGSVRHLGCRSLNLKIVAKPSTDKLFRLRSPQEEIGFLVSGPVR